MDQEVRRLTYIGSKYQLLDTLAANIKAVTGWTSFENKRVADLFAGTGIVSYYFRQQHAATFSNDVEAYSAIITNAMALAVYSDQCQRVIETLQTELADQRYLDTVGFITKHYSPYQDNQRMYFTVDNARRIDYLRQRIEDLKPELTDTEHNFLLASLLLSADRVSNVPAVYASYLKRFKSKAARPLVMLPIHTMRTPAHLQSSTHNEDVLSKTLATKLGQSRIDLVYLDPPYNGRQYSKNYFPLNVIALPPAEQQNVKLTGLTGIPNDCFLSPFCQKNTIEDAFNRLLRQIDAEWTFLSYNSEGLITKERMLELMSQHGQASVIESDYKRFKSFKYNRDVEIKEYLFCLKRN